MKFVEPKVEYWPQKSATQQVARVGRICYKSQPKQPDENLSEAQQEAFREEQDFKLCKRFWDSGHKSMLRHGSLYFFVPNDRKLPGHIWSILYASPFIEYANKEHKTWISTNTQFINENLQLSALLRPYSVTEDEFIEKATKESWVPAFLLLRMTLVVTTQISTTRELNRTSPNAIAEQSTRYCNLEKKGGVQIAQPHWMMGATRWQKLLYISVCKFSDWAYRRLLKTGMKPQDARGVLPLDTYTVAAYTYSISEWKHILDLRYHETTGKAHPNAHLVAAQMYDLIKERLAPIAPEIEL